MSAGRRPGVWRQLAADLLGVSAIVIDTVALALTDSYVWVHIAPQTSDEGREEC